MSIGERAVRATGAVETLARIVQLRRRDAWTRERIERHQAQRLTVMVEHALARSRFYGGLYRAVGVGAGSRLNDLPTVDKPLLMANFDDVVTDRRLKLADLEAHLAQLRGDELYLGQYRVTSTGGSSGIRGVFACDRREWALSVVSTLRTGGFMDLRGHLGRRLRVASVTAASPVHWAAATQRPRGSGSRRRSTWTRAPRRRGSSKRSTVTGRIC